MTHSPNGRILEEIISGIKVNSEETEQNEPVDSSKTINSCVQVPQEENHPEPAKLDPLKLQLDKKDEDQCPSVASMVEELPRNKSCLSPLAARAALASLVSTAYDGGTNGTELDDHHITDNMSTIDDSLSEDPSSLGPVVRETVNLVEILSLDENHISLKPQLEESAELNDTRARPKGLTAERKSARFARTGRVTRTPIYKSNSSITDAEDIPRSGSRDSQDLALPSGFEDKANLTFKEGEEDADLVQSTKSGNSKRSKPKKSTVTQKQEKESSVMEAGLCNPAEEVGDQKSTFAVNNQPTKGKATGQSVKRKLTELQVPGRVTRSAVQKAPGNADNDVRVKSCDKDVQERVSKKTRRSICFTGLEKAENFTGSQDLDNDNSVQSTKSDHSEMNMSEEEDILAREEETVSLQMDSEEQNLAAEKVKAKTSSSIKKAKQGKFAGHTAKSREQNMKSASDNQSKKSTSNSSNKERRFSHRLRFLPRTRSQVKS